VLSALASLLIRGYQLVLSPILHTLAGPGFGCRFHPTCSHFAAQAIRRHGAFRGSWLALGRVLRCRPGAAGGYDPVPECGTPPPSWIVGPS
jgi:uncharacterized protein